MSKKEELFSNVFFKSGSDPDLNILQTRMAWVLELSVIYDAKDGAYGSYGSETLSKFQRVSKPTAVSKGFKSLKKEITYLIGMERQSGSMDDPSALYISRMLNVPLEEVEACMKEREV